MLKERRAFLFVNGDLPNGERIKTQIHADDFLIAVDGGLRHMQGLGLVPALLIGDLDSISADQLRWAQQQGCQIEKYPPEKDETDLELGLQAALKHDCSVLTIVAALGGRLDQTLGNLSLLRLPQLAQCQVKFDDGEVEVFIIRTQAQIEGAAGDTLSLLPLWGAVPGVSTKSLLYPLHAETLYPDHTRGISNEMQSSHAQVQISSGELLCIHTRNLKKDKE